MASPLQMDTALKALLLLWARRQEYPGWHGYGVGGLPGMETLACFTLRRAESGPLLSVLRAIGDPNGLPSDVLELPMFKGIPSGKKHVPKLGPLAPEQITPGSGVYAISDGCGILNVGTIGALLRVRATPKDPPWLLSNHHVLARSKRCRKNLKILLDVDDHLVSDRMQPVELADDSNLVDAAVAQLDHGDPANPVYVCPQVTSNAPVVPALQSVVQKFGIGTACTSGVYVYSCPHLTLDESDSGIATAGFINQMVIASTSDTSPFAGPGDSGSLVVSGGKPAGLLFGISTPPPQEGIPGPGPWGLASPFQVVLDQIGAKLGSPVEMMLNGVKGG